MLEPTPINGKALLAREAAARREGSGITAASLEGEWWLQQLWTREGSDQNATAALLRTVGASLAIRQGGSHLELCNRVQLGPLVLEFTGPGQLSGKRPLLRFRFGRVALLWAGRVLWQASLPEPGPQQMPFFALIACQRLGDQGWLAARGRGGGLALWRLRPSAVRG